MSAEPMSPERLAEIRAAIDLALEVLPPKGRARYLTAQWFWTAGIDLLAEVDRLRADPPPSTSDPMPEPMYPTQAITSAWSWWVVPDDVIGGWAIATTGYPVSEQRPHGGWVVANFVSRDTAEHIVALHNGSLG